MKHFIPLCILLIFLAGCKKKDDPVPSDPGLTLSLAWKAKLRWTVNGPTANGYSTMIFVTDHDTSDLYAGKKQPISVLEIQVL